MQREKNLWCLRGDAGLGVRGRRGAPGPQNLLKNHKNAKDGYFFNNNIWFLGASEHGGLALGSDSVLGHNVGQQELNPWEN